MLAWAVEQARDWEAAAAAGEAGAAAALDPNYHMFTCDNRSAASFTIGVSREVSILKFLDTLVRQCPEIPSDILVSYLHHSALRSGPPSQRGSAGEAGDAGGAARGGGGPGPASGRHGSGHEGGR